MEGKPTNFLSEKELALLAREKRISKGPPKNSSGWSMSAPVSISADDEIIQRPVWPGERETT